MSLIKRFPLLMAGIIFFLLVTVLSPDVTGLLNGYFMVIIERSMIGVIFAISLNLINGITGQFSLGHMGFAAVGAYSWIIANEQLGPQIARGCRPWASAGSAFCSW